MISKAAAMDSLQRSLMVAVFILLCGPTVYAVLLILHYLYGWLVGVILFCMITLLTSAGLYWRATEDK